MTKDEALDLALVALEYIENNYMSLPKSGTKAITAIKQARSAPAQEPVAFNAGVPPLYPEMKDGETISVEYTTPPAAPVQEPVATLWQHGETGRTRVTMPGDITDCDARWFKAADLYTTPPAAQRQWVGLTVEEIHEALLSVDPETKRVPVGFARFAYAIEAKLRSKNDL